MRDLERPLTDAADVERSRHEVGCCVRRRREQENLAVRSDIERIDRCRCVVCGDRDSANGVRSAGEQVSDRLIDANEARFLQMRDVTGDDTPPPVPEFDVLVRVCYCFQI